MSDIANELRERSLRAEQEGEPLALLDDAADEIERLRLTDAEREAIRSLAPSGDPLASRTVTLTPDVRRVFHGLLERLGGTNE